MDIRESLFLGMVQGFSEFLPISSSGHLILIPWLFKWQKHSLNFDIILHLGSLAALLLYFGKYWIRLVNAGVSSIKEHRIAGYSERKTFWLVVVSTIPSAIIGILLKHQAETIFRNPLLVSMSMGFFAIVFFIIEHFSRKERNLNEITYTNAFVLGMLQILAIVPGVSRAGITIAGGLALRLKREAATEFSFLIAFPIILGAAILKTKEILELFASGNSLSLLIGLTCSMLCGIFAIKYLLSFTRRHGFSLFIIYRIALCLIILYIYTLRR